MKFKKKKVQRKFNPQRAKATDPKKRLELTGKKEGKQISKYLQKPIKIREINNTLA